MPGERESRLMRGCGCGGCDVPVEVVIDTCDRREWDGGKARDGDVGIQEVRETPPLPWVSDPKGAGEFT